MKKMLREKKGAFSINDVVPLGITLVVIAIVLGVGADVLDQVQSTQTSNSYAYNASNNGLKGIDELSGFQQTWGIVIALAVIIGILGFLYVRN